MPQVSTLPTNQPNFKDETDKTFNHWTVLSYAGNGQWKLLVADAKRTERAQAVKARIDY